MAEHIPLETLATWREDACKRGGVPQPGDADPYVRYLANRICALIDAFAPTVAAYSAGPTDEPVEKPRAATS